MPPAKSHQELVDCVWAVCRVIGSIPAFHAFTRYLYHSAPVGKESLRDAIYNATLDSLLMHTRCLDEFFDARKIGRPNDVRATDFAGCQMDSFLEEDERKNINWQLAHMTTQRKFIESTSWDVDGIVKRALEKGVEFLKWVKENSGLQLDNTTEQFRQETIKFCEVMLNNLARSSDTTP